MSSSKAKSNLSEAAVADMKQKMSGQPVPDAEASSPATAPVPRCAKTGRSLDQWGLPLNGPARVAALQELGLPDPHENPGAWDESPPIWTVLSSKDRPDAGDMALPADAQQIGEKD